jgi:hypothetical protein
MARSPESRRVRRGSERPAHPAHPVGNRRRPVAARLRRAAAEPRAGTRWASVRVGDRSPGAVQGRRNAGSVSQEAWLAGPRGRPDPRTATPAVRLGGPGRPIGSTRGRRSSAGPCSAAARRGSAEPCSRVARQRRHRGLERGQRRYPDRPRSPKAQRAAQDRPLPDFSWSRPASLPLHSLCPQNEHTCSCPIIAAIGRFNP